MEAGHPGILAALAITGETNRRVTTVLADVDALLIELIAPDGRQIAERDLEGWPDVDLQQLVQDEI